ncbi:DUF2878 domain-containing protein [Marinobacterium sp. YM272]|uniref:DUF2878 domain-containing protein n=1 Tax=Marinobacterium sp. YM272 TaxID=3421654 RepID=UPI003D7F677B
MVSGLSLFSGLSCNFWISLIGFQAIWWSLILWGNSALLPAMLLLLAHLLFHRTPRQELQLMIYVALPGFLVDSMLTLAGVFVFPATAMVAPAWLLLLWFAFAATLNQALGWFSGRYLLAALIGGVGGSSTYIAAAELGAVSLGLGLVPAFLLLTLVWTLLFPFLIWLKDYRGGRDVCALR